MHLKSLELHGFKSFPDKTLLTFDDGATVIVGPNGSGKSNITDAMRWVLGEISSKNIRGSKLEDVIFIGAENRKPMSFAEVSVTFDNSSEEGRLNSPFDEITVTRRYLRAGKSEYLINRTPCRLGDIFQLFMNTGVGREGYSIIGQGRIAEIISKKSEDRRNIFEEAAGISKTRHVKTEAEKNLKNTQENLDRVSDLYNELSRRIGTLERDAQKAKIFLELSEKKKGSDIALWVYQSKKNKSEIESLENNFNMATHELETANGALNQISNQQNMLSEKFQKTKLDEERIYSEIKACNTTISDLDRDLAIMETNHKNVEVISGEELAEIEKLEAKKNLALSEIDQNQAKVEEVKKMLSALQDSHEDLIKEKEGFQLKFNEASKELDDLFEEQKRLNEELSQISIRIAFLNSVSSSDKEKATSNDDNIGQIKAELDKMISDSEMKAQGLAKQESALSSLENELKNTEEELTQKAEIFDNLKLSKDEYNSQLLSLTERINTLKTMEELFEGYSKSVSYIMNAYKNNELNGVGKIYGPISHLISTKDEYRIAIETALGVGLQHIVVDDEETAKACIYSLKQSKSGRATFYPVSSVKPQDSTYEMEMAKSFKGYIGVANELLDFDDLFEDIFSSLLGRTLIFDNIENATEMAKAQKYRVKVVTLDGQQINTGGSFTGGSVKHESDVLSRASKIKHMEEELLSVNEKLDAIKAEGKELGDLLKTLSSKQVENKQQYNIIDAIYRNDKTEYETLLAQINLKKELLEGLEYDKQKLADDEQKSAIEISELTEKSKALNNQIEEITTKRLDIDEQKYEYEEKINECTEKISGCLIDVVKVEKDLEVASAVVLDSKNKLDDINEQLSTRRDKIQRLNDDVGSFSQKREDNRKAYDDAKKRLTDFEAQRLSLSELEQQIERKRNELSLKVKEISSKKEILSRNHGSIAEQLKQKNENREKMRERLKEEYGLEPSDAYNLDYPEVNERNYREVSAEVNDYKQRIKELGSVNTAAIQDYINEKERYDMYHTQITDLEKSKAFILDEISKLEEEMKTKFVSAFNAVNENFNIVFKELFGGGHAELLLDNPDDLLNCGIEIKAAPPGKVIKSLMLLSGGEQAFVAIALLFAILKVNPTPFCIFDEIEAALDEVNVTRFGQYIKRYSKQTQFIVITHRRGTMEIADKLYGVTMHEKGISKVLTMDVNDVGNDKILETNNPK